VSEIIEDGVLFHPVQATDMGRRPYLPATVTLRAYEVYSYIYGEQPKMVMDGCRGGFGVGEIVSFLYAHSFPKHEWRARHEEALRRPLKAFP
jgi:hypothetical protein